MKRSLAFFIFLILISTPFLHAEKIDGVQTAIISEKVLVESIGFGLKEQTFKVVEFKLSEMTLVGNNQKADSQPPKVVGKLSIAGIGHKLKIIKPQLENFEADIVVPSEEKGLFLPIGHISLKLSEADAKHLVMTGELKILVENDEENSGEFKVYLNVKPADTKNLKD